MKYNNTTIFSRIILLIAGLITGLGLLFIIITYIVATNYHEASTQLLDKDVAAHIAKFSTPFGPNGLDKQKADSVFFDAMVLSPNSEVYFLDTNGKVAGYHESEFQVTAWIIPLKKIKAYIAAGGKEYIKGQDPRDPSSPKIFSASEVINNGKLVGYIYVILNSSQSRIAASALFGNHVIILCVAAFSVVLLITFVLSLLYVRRIQRRFNSLISVLNRFEEGDFNARFDTSIVDGLANVKSAFNKMADLLVYHINRLTKSETDRKVFTAGITHDLRNPLAIAGGYAETLLIRSKDESLKSGQLEDYAHLILNKVRLVERMVTQLHDLSSMDAISFEPKPEPFMFSELVQEVAYTFHQQANGRGINIDCSHCKDDAYVLADVSMMERVIQNLLANAVTNSPEQATISVKLLKTDRLLSFSVTNTGTPLSKPITDWLMSNIQGEQNAQPQASALGLSIVKRILDKHGFPLDVHCEHGNVSFCFSMPIYLTQTMK